MILCVCVVITIFLGLMTSQVSSRSCLLLRRNRFLPVYLFKGLKSQYLDARVSSEFIRMSQGLGWISGDSRALSNPVRSERICSFSVLVNFCTAGLA